MAEKEGKKFELYPRLFAHVAHNRFNYPNGRCVVSILLLFSVLEDCSIRYLSVPIGYRIWYKKQTKMEIAAEMVCNAMDSIVSDRCSCFAADGIAKDVVDGLMDEYCNLDIICSVKINTTMHDLSPERMGKFGCPKKYGERLSPENFVLESPQTGDWKIGVRPVLTKLWEEQVVYTIVIFLKRGNGSRKIFFFVPKSGKHSFGIIAGARMMPRVDMGKKM